MAKKLYGIVFFVAFALCSRTAHAKPEEWITIFVHGSSGGSLHPKFFSQLLKTDICKTCYFKKTIENRCQPSWTRHHAAQPGSGLQRIDREHPVMCAAQLFASLYDQIQKMHSPDQTTLDYYTFDWSGAINHNERCKAGKQLYYELKDLMKTLLPQHPNIKIRVIGYSHGGNVALNMVPYRDEDPEPLNFVVDELIMIAMPTQRETDCNALDDFFTKAYAIFSRADCVQKMDCFAFGRIFSGRTFKDTCRCVFGNKVQHIELKITMAAENDLKLDNYPSKKRIDRSPGHIELWYFAQLCECPYGSDCEYCLESTMYRAYFPLEPLPAAILTPALIKVAQDRAQTSNIIIEVQPDTGKAVIRPRYSRQKEVIDFMSPQTLDAMKEASMPYLTKNARRP